MEDGRAEGLSAIGDGGQGAVLRTHVQIFESLQLEGSYVGYLTVFKVGVKRGQAGNKNLTVIDMIILKAMRVDEITWGMDVD